MKRTHAVSPSLKKGSTPIIPSIISVLPTSSLIRRPSGLTRLASQNLTPIRPPQTHHLGTISPSLHGTGAKTYACKRLIGCARAHKGEGTFHSRIIYRVRTSSALRRRCKITLCLPMWMSCGFPFTWRVRQWLNPLDRTCSGHVRPAYQAKPLQSACATYSSREQKYHRTASAM